MHTKVHDSKLREFTVFRCYSKIIISYFNSISLVQIIAYLNSILGLNAYALLNANFHLNLNLVV